MQRNRVLLSLTMAICFAANCVGQDGGEASVDKADKEAARAVRQTTARMMKFFAPAKLDDAQKAKALTIIKKRVPKILAARKAQEALLTDAQKEARDAARAQLKKDGVKGAKLLKGAFDAMGLSKEEMKEFLAARKKVVAVATQIPLAISTLLNEDQLATMPKFRTLTAAPKTQTVSLNLPGMV